jgi:RNA polymerase sigma factor (TIGR02999 family)
MLPGGIAPNRWVASSRKACYHLERLMMKLALGDIMADVTRVISAIEDGDPDAAEQLLPLVYEELRKLAAAKMAQEKAGQTLQATALVHEAYVRLVQGDDERAWENRRHFFAAAAESMRRILVENARRKGRLKRGGERIRRDLDEEAVVAAEPDGDILELDTALTRLEAKNARSCEVVKLRYFAGLTVSETADALGISTSSVDRDWSYARAWLFREMNQD